MKINIKKRLGKQKIGGFCKKSKNRKHKTETVEKFDDVRMIEKKIEILKFQYKQ